MRNGSSEPLVPIVNEASLKSINDRLTSWRELTCVQAMLERIRRFQNEDGSYEDAKEIFFVITRLVSRNVANNGWCDAMVLRHDFMETLYYAMAEYMHGMLLHARYFGDSYVTGIDCGFPILKLRDLCRTAVTMNMALNGNFRLEGMPIRRVGDGERERADYGGARLCVTSEEEHQFDLLIRELTLKAGIVKLDNQAFEFLKQAYWRRMYAIFEGIGEAFRSPIGNNYIGPEECSSPDVLMTASIYDDPERLSSPFAGIIPLPHHIEQWHLRDQMTKTVNRKVCGIGSGSQCSDKDYQSDSGDSADYSSEEDAEVFLKSCDYAKHDEEVSSPLDGTGHDESELEKQRNKERRASYSMLADLLLLHNDFNELVGSFRITSDRRDFSAALNVCATKIQSLREHHCSPLPEPNRKCPSEHDDSSDKEFISALSKSHVEKLMLANLLCLQNDFNLLVDSFRITLDRRDIPAALDGIASKIQILKEAFCDGTRPEPNRKRKQQSS